MTDVRVVITIRSVVSFQLDFVIFEHLSSIGSESTEVYSLTRTPMMNLHYLLLVINFLINFMIS